MASMVLTSLFAAAIVIGFVLKTWLATRQMRHVAAHRDAVPAAFVGTVSLEAHQKAADYTLARGNFGLISMAVGTIVLVGWTLLGGLDLLNALVRDAVLPRWGAMAYQLALLAAVALVGGVIEAPLDAWSTFRIEQRFGFNRTTWKLYLIDAAKGVLVGAAIGLPLAALVLWLMGAAGTWWWLWAWVAWTGFQLLMLVLYPTVIAPLFNKFSPLPDASLAERVGALMARCGFRAKGLFVMDACHPTRWKRCWRTSSGTSSCGTCPSA
jgi:STE24 endopeptidase